METENPIQKAMAWYLRVVDEAIEDRPQAGGRVEQVGNIDRMRELIREAPKEAQVAIQYLYSVRNQVPDEGRDVVELHGRWLMVAYLMEHGRVSPSSVMLQKFAGGFYAAAVEDMKRQAL